MTEAEWLNATHPYQLIYHPSCRSERKRRLFACACARRTLGFLPDPRFSEVLVGCEQFADASLDWKGVLVLRKSLRMARNDLQAGGGLEHQNHAALAIEYVTSKEFMSFKMAVEASESAFASLTRPDWDLGHGREVVAQLHLARDIFLNPFQPIVFDPSWRTDIVTALVRGAYDSRDFSAMPILADALQDAGCDNEAILNHCRDENATHVRGCWVLDLVLEKS